MIRRPPRSPLFPYPPLSRSQLLGRPTPPPAASAPATPGMGVTPQPEQTDRKSTRLNSSHSQISYAVFCLKKKKKTHLHRKPHPRRDDLLNACLAGERSRLDQ